MELQVHLNMKTPHKWIGLPRCDMRQNIQNQNACKMAHGRKNQRERSRRVSHTRNVIILGVNCFPLKVKKSPHQLPRTRREIYKGKTQLNQLHRFTHLPKNRILMHREKIKPLLFIHHPKRSKRTQLKIFKHSDFKNLTAVKDQNVAMSDMLMTFQIITALKTSCRKREK